MTKQSNSENPRPKPYLDFRIKAVTPLRPKCPADLAIFLVRYTNRDVLVAQLGGEPYLTILDVAIRNLTLNG